MYDPTTKAVSYGAIPVQDLNPLTLDNTNDRVGINQAVPTEALDVVGNVLISGNLNTGNVTALGLSSSTLDTDLTTTDNLSLTAIPNTSKPDVLMYDSTTKSVSYGAIPVQDLTPITLDTTNTPNRVGINKAEPIYTLDVNGSLRTGKLIVLGSSSETLIWTDTPNNFVGIGTTTPTTLLDVDGNAKIKTLELTEIPSATAADSLYYDAATKSVSYGPTPSIPVPVSSLVYVTNAAVWNSPSISNGERKVITSWRMAPNSVYEVNAQIIVKKTTSAAVGMGALISINQNMEWGLDNDTYFNNGNPVIETTTSLNQRRKFNLTTIIENDTSAGNYDIALYFTGVQLSSANSFQIGANDLHMSILRLK
jgi:hypothetical protein